MVMVAVLLAVLVGFVFVSVAFTYNTLVQLRFRVKNAWSQIDVQLKRRHDLIPNLVEVAKGYMKFEKETLENVIKARTQATQATEIKDKQEAENFLTQTLRSLFAVVERYPDLKANQNMLKLQEELTTTENKISFARQFYNDETTAYNTAIHTFPTNAIAPIFNFKDEVLFELSDLAEKEPPKVSF
jgi:LemA protein